MPVEHGRRQLYALLQRPLAAGILQPRKDFQDARFVTVTEDNARLAVATDRHPG
jgi:hypothetical protein